METWNASYPKRTHDEPWNLTRPLDDFRPWRGVDKSFEFLFVNTYWYVRKRIFFVNNSRENVLYRKPSGRTDGNHNGFRFRNVGNGKHWLPKSAGKGGVCPGRKPLSDRTSRVCTHIPVQTPCRYFATLLQTVFRPRVYLPLTQLGSCFVTRRDGGERDKEKKLAAVSFPNAKGLSGLPLISRFRRRRSCPSHPLVCSPLSLCRLRLRLSLSFSSRLIFPGVSLFYLFILSISPQTFYVYCSPYESTTEASSLSLPPLLRNRL